MKPIILIAVLFCCCLVAQTQTTDAQAAPSGIVFPLKFEYEEECGNPAYESMLWMSVEGRVVKIVDGDTFVLITKEKKRKRIDLAGVDAGESDKSARLLLTTLILNKDVSVMVNPSRMKSSNLVGRASTPVMDVNRSLLEAGVARYKESKSYSLSRYTACLYRMVEAKAREAKQGLWRDFVPQ